MRILSIESSCDETAAAVIEDGRTILSSVVDTQIETHALYGGVVPEIASRRHTEAVVRVTEEALQRAGMTKNEVDAVAATCAPGLIGALLVGANFGKSLAFALQKPFVPVHHIRGHIAAVYLAYPELKPPFLTLIASGGHSQIVMVRDYTTFEILGGTRDDAAGEAFDKVARVLGVGYPGGPKIDELAQTGDPTKYKLPHSQIKDAPLDFSFSGLKTAVINLAHNAEQKGEALDREALAASFCRAVVDTLVPRLELAVKQSGGKNIVCAGGVAANSFLRAALTDLAARLGLALYLPPLSLCGDNAAMIGSQAYYEFLAGNTGTTLQNAFATAEIGENVCIKR
ncbi:tRNA (adenosine(37)-N6)-threonylcarbamoyltransferase complex transferase subunit TsaD [Agathobaculum sp. NTUH-O15-33]|uniref:tRNA (adenosine(37)-N6)-threonylcarbamoyltransferase complex transferase subunit TsaD n=1 Tax=Agathobaculum sp. NTUH-O15-33 TaxID=3079302 RepID=UPI002958D80A|nr:tRNA (adenosine(37)-N6)-threonylcarbamoyltransferase complex transferase subunit TsaD [Agathobaculum sp. NTUH-O15-33]WNX83127.1 tRNA (adenosine(37)-N6)-threonylcarbamoyltransferase complex transferase subunit TsaD [Agathobaculum sp. NTUH-O15-33]